MSLSQFPTHQPPRILVVEDEPLIAMDLEDTLRDAGYGVAGPVASVDAALDVLNSQRVDAAVLDLNLNGQLSSPVAADLKRRSIPFCLCTAYQRLLFKEGAPFDGIKVFGKPILPLQLLTAVELLIDSVDRGQK